MSSEGALPRRNQYGSEPIVVGPRTSRVKILKPKLPSVLLGAGVSQQLQTIQVQPSSQQKSNHSGSDACSPAPSTAGLSVVSSSSCSSSTAGHMMYPGGPTVMYATPSPSLLNAFPHGHAPPHDPGAVQQVFLTSLPPVPAQIPVSAVQLHPMVIGAPGGGLAELQVVSLDVHQPKDN